MHSCIILVYVTVHAMTELACRRINYVIYPHIEIPRVIRVCANLEMASICSAHIHSNEMFENPIAMRRECIEYSYLIIKIPLHKKPDLPASLFHKFILKLRWS